jgi:hypothetical protein
MARDCLYYDLMVNRRVSGEMANSAFVRKQQ